MISSVEGQRLRDRLVEDGFVTVPDILTGADLTRWRAVAERLLAARGDKHASIFKAQGSMIRTIADPEFADLVAHPATLAVLAAMGWAPTHTDGYLISKPPGGVRLFWHYDWFAWDDPVSYANQPGQIFAMYYLQDTRPENGCLRVIPGSHRRPNALHRLLGEPHGAALTAAENMAAPEFSTRPDEVDVVVQAGDLVLGDARLLHAAHANSSAERRSLITLLVSARFRCSSGVDPGGDDRQGASSGRRLSGSGAGQARSALAGVRRRGGTAPAHRLAASGSVINRVTSLMIVSPAMPTSHRLPIGAWAWALSQGALPV